MLTSLLAEALAVTFENLTMTVSIFECAEEATADLSPEARQRLKLVHTGLAMAIQAMEYDEFQQLLKRSDIYCDC